MDYLRVTESEFDDILSVFQERGIEILHLVQDGQVRICPIRRPLGQNCESRCEKMSVVVLESVGFCV